MTTRSGVGQGSVAENTEMMHPSGLLPPGLTFCVAQADEDLERIATLHAQTFDRAIRDNVLSLARHYPGVQLGDFAYVLDEESGEAVSSICLVPQTWQYEGVPLRVAELGIVGTHPDYRRQGLIRAQMRWFERRLLQDGFHLAAIQGIPHFYRQFGYEYTLPLGPTVLLPPEQVPDPLEGEEQPGIRPAQPEDRVRLLTLMAAANQGLAISYLREPAAWAHQDDPIRQDDEAIITLVVMEGRQVAGYFRLFRHESHAMPGVTIVEASPLSHHAALAALRYAKQVSTTRRIGHGIRLALPISHPLARLALYLGGRSLDPYAWLVRIPDPVRFLVAIAPALEARLENSFLAGFDSFLRLDLYTETLELRFQSGRMVSVRNLGCLESQAARLPWWAAWQLWLGCRSRAELMAWYPDARISERLQPLVDTLFPKRPSWIWPTL